MNTLALSWAKRFDAVALAESAGITLDPWQEELVSSTALRFLLNCSRQVGKSTTVAVIAAYTALYQPGSTTLLLSPSLRQSSELFRKCMDIYRANDRPVPSTAETILRLELSNGSRIVSLPGNEETIRGISKVDLLLLDEAARVKDALYKSVRPMLAVGHGRLGLLSSPFGSRGFFWEEWMRREGRWKWWEIPAWKCPRITQEFLDEELESLGQWWYDQEYGCAFHDPIGAAFRSQDIERLIKPEVDQWNLF